MKLVLKLSEFEILKFDINMSTFSYCGNIDDYDRDDIKSFNSISFVLADTSKTEEVIDYVKSRFLLSNVDVNRYIKVKDVSISHEEVSVSRFSILFRPGYRGWSNPPIIHFE